MTENFTLVISSFDEAYFRNYPMANIRPWNNDNYYKAFNTTRDAFMAIAANKEISYKISWRDIVKVQENFTDLEVIKIFLSREKKLTTTWLHKHGFFNLLTLKLLAEHVDWLEICQNNYFDFDRNFINQYKDYIIFSYFMIVNGKLTDTYNSTLYNIRGQQYTSYHGRYSYKGLSSSILVKWNEAFLDEFENYWDWKLLSSNSSIPFTRELIAKYSFKWSWPILSHNSAIYWDIDLVREFINFLNIPSLCSNPQVNWIDVLPFFYDHPKASKLINWNSLSNNPSLDTSLIKDNYPFVFKHDHGQSHSYFKKNLATHKYNLVITPSLSSNTGILWIDELLAIHKDSLDFWLIALRGRISPELVMKYSVFFNENRYVSTSYVKHSDWGTFGVSHFHSGWQNFGYNKNFAANPDILEWSKGINVKLVDSYDPFDSPTNSEASPEWLIENSDFWVSLHKIISNPGGMYKFE